MTNFVFRTRDGKLRADAVATEYLIAVSNATVADYPDDQCATVLTAVIPSDSTWQDVYYKLYLDGGTLKCDPDYERPEGDGADGGNGSEPTPPTYTELTTTAHTLAAHAITVGTMADAMVDDVAPLFDPWGAGEDVTVGDIRTYNGEVYVCLQDHTTQADWTPDVAASLWAPYRDSAVTAEWEQPTGATDAYPKGAKVLHDGKTWVADVDSDVWEPGVSQWTELDTT
jgi:hypothetical protein